MMGEFSESFPLKLYILICDLRFAICESCKLQTANREIEKGTALQPSLLYNIVSAKLLHNHFGGIDFAVLVDLEHINAAVEVSHVHLSGTGDGFAVNLLTNDVEELDISFFIVAKVHGEVVRGRVRINSGVVLLDFRNVHDFAVGAGNFQSQVFRVVVIVKEEHGIEIVNITVIERTYHSAVASVVANVGVAGGRVITSTIIAVESIKRE